jgi:hypothetical protein
MKQRNRKRLLLTQQTVAKLGWPALDSIQGGVAVWASEAGECRLTNAASRAMNNDSACFPKP